MKNGLSIKKRDKNIWSTNIIECRTGATHRLVYKQFIVLSCIKCQTESVYISFVYSRGSDSRHFLTIIRTIKLPSYFFSPSLILLVLSYIQFIYIYIYIYIYSLHMKNNCINHVRYKKITVLARDFNHTHAVDYCQCLSCLRLRYIVMQK